MKRKCPGGICLYSHSGKKLGGPYKTEAAFARRLRQVEYFKHRGKKK